MYRLEDYLDICIITYNRSSYLDVTITKFLNSPFKNCKLFIIDNCSTDDTQAVAEKYGNKIEYRRNRFNIGANANIMRAFEYGENPYVWVIGDDDDYDFGYIDDLIPILNDGIVELIHVGAHTDVDWNYGGKIVNTQKIIAEGYPFFRFSSFIGCNIVKRNAVEKFAIQGYNNIVNSYPHMPFLLSFYEEDKPIYICINRIAKAVIGNQGYNNDSLIKWWGGTCNLIKNYKDKRKCFFQQFCNSNKYKQLLVWRYQYHTGLLSRSSYKMAISFFSKTEKLVSLLGYIPYYFYKFVKTKVNLNTSRS